MAVRRPAFKPQIGDPTTTLDSHICTLECGAMGLDVLTNGNINVWGGQLIPFCGRTPLEIVQRGTNLNNIKAAWSHWGKTLDIRTGLPWASALNDLRNGYWVILQGDYDQFTTLTKCQDNFNGGHAVLLGPEFLINGNVLYADPLCKAFKYVSQSELRNFANKLGKTEYGGAWTGQIFYARIKPEPFAAPHYAAIVTTPTSLWNDSTKRWVYSGSNAIKVGTRLEVRGARYTKGGKLCYPITSGAYSKNYAGYYVPIANVKLGGKV